MTVAEDLGRHETNTKPAAKESSCVLAGNYNGLSVIAGEVVYKTNAKFSDQVSLCVLVRNCVGLSVIAGKVV